MNIERRAINGQFFIERRNGNEEMEEQYYMKGYALKFGVQYDMGWFTEEVDRDALRGANMEDVRVLLNHDANLILGRTTAGTARVMVDDIGLYYECMLPDSPNGRNVKVAIERGDITQSSWGFSVRGDMWGSKDGVKDHRIITDVAFVYDASPVTYPANPDTSAAKRSRDAAIQEKRADTYADYPDAARNNARRAIEHKEKNGSDCGTRVGWFRAAQLSAGEGLTRDEVKRTYSFLSRAEVYDQGEYMDDEGNEICGSIMYDAWGGSAMLPWARSKVAEFEKETNSSKVDYHARYYQLITKY